MTWFKVDDNLAFHTKVIKAGNAAMGLWVRAGSWCGQHLTDGLIPAEVAKMMGKPSEIKRLVDAGLWEIEADSYRFHDWFASNPSREQVEDHREVEREKKARWRARKAGKSDGDPGQEGLSTVDTTVDTTGDSQVRSPSGRDRVSTSSRPDPTRPTTSSNEEVGTPRASRRGSRIPEDFVPSESLVAWGADLGFTERALLDLTAEFIDYWRGVPGQKGVKLDWEGTWRNHIRRQDPAKWNRRLRPVAGEGRSRVHRDPWDI